MSELNLDELDLWVIKRHLELRENKFYGKVTITYVEGKPTHRDLNVSEKPVFDKKA